MIKAVDLMKQNNGWETTAAQYRVSISKLKKSFDLNCTKNYLIIRNTTAKTIMGIITINILIL